MGADGVVVSVIVACSDQKASLGACLSSLLRRSSGAWELVVVDDGSVDGTADYLAGVRDAAQVRVEVITNLRRMGVPAAINLGLKAARGEFLALLAPEVVVTDGWLDQLIALARTRPEIGIVGPMTNGASPPQFVESPAFDRSEDLSAFSKKWRDENRGRWFRVESLSLACILMKRFVYESIGGLDERLAPGHALEDDLARKAREAGVALAVARDVFVHHGGERPSPEEELRTRQQSGSTPQRESARGASVPLATVTVNPRSTMAPEERRTGRSARVSLTMIVRNEVGNLEACLESAAGLFDEIVVVDTGSTDRTVEVARALGAVVFPFPWVDDFSAARNASLAHATGDYAFWLDADDRIEPPARERLGRLLDRLGGTPSAYLMRCSCDPGPDGSGGAVVDHIRLFPLRADIRWVNRVHEQILPALKKGGVGLARADVTIRHVGYSDPDLRRRKLDRDQRLSLADLAERPDDPFVLFNLGWIAMERKDYLAALPHLRASLAASGSTDAITRKLYALIALAHQRLGQAGEALAACAEGLAIAQGDPELLFREAVVRRINGDRDGAAACWRTILERPGPDRPFSSVPPGISGHLTRRNLAALAEEDGDIEEALRHWDAVAEECPGDTEAAVARDRLLGRASLATSDEKARPTRRESSERPRSEEQ